MDIAKFLTDSITQVQEFCDDVCRDDYPLEIEDKLSLLEGSLNKCKASRFFVQDESEHTEVDKVFINLTMTQIEIYENAIFKVRGEK